jgi:hypothetical protein
MVEFTLHYMGSNSCGGESSIATFLQKLRTTTVNEYLFTSTGYVRRTVNFCTARRSAI